jgi:two-component system nitrate/nitrite sensor histidine kinase NarX
VQNSSKMGVVNPSGKPVPNTAWSPSILRMAAGFLVLIALSILGAAWIWPLDILILQVFLILAIGGVVFYLLRQLMQLQSEISMASHQVEQLQFASRRIEHRSTAIMELSQKFVEANDEHEVLNALLTEIVSLVGAVGASIVPLDERGQPLTALSHGEIPKPLMDSWVEYLASPEVRHQCRSCQQTGSMVHACPLIDQPVFNQLGQSQPSSIFCLHLRRGEREMAILNLYLDQDDSIDDETRAFLLTLLDETALVLESLQAKKREFTILQQIRNHTDTRDLQLDFLENVQETLLADFVLLQISEEIRSESRELHVGELPGINASFIDGVMEGVLKSGQPVLLGNVESGTPPGLRSLICAPLVISDDPAFGVLLAGRTHATAFSSRHLSLLHTLADQLSLVVRNAELRAEIEFNSIMAERTRLAREIHDGLAQTLGFLKLQAAQMENYLVSEDINRLGKSLSMTYKVLSDAYLDVRQAIDDLRISPGSEGLEAWLKETTREFVENTGIQVRLAGTPAAEKLPQEIQVQLIRIIQEALSNVRKHAHASQAWIEYRQEGAHFTVEIRDDGRGFHPDELPGVSRYGLQGMHERADIIGADLVIISAPEEGTIIKVRVPVPSGESVP